MDAVVLFNIINIANAVHDQIAKSQHRNFNLRISHNANWIV